jgi:hypothetical protein
MLDDDQGVDAPQQHGVHMEEIDCENAAGLRGEELLSGRAGAAGCGAGPGVTQDLPDRGGSDRVAESDEFALHAPVPPVGSSATMRITSSLIAASADGPPGRRRLVQAHLRAASRRCQASSAAGVTANT